MISDELNKGYLVFAKQIAYEAGEIMRKYFDKDPKRDYKSDESVVTIADIEINELVIRSVKAAYPGHGVYGEETSHNQDARSLWVCDPIDGTALFARNIAMSVFSLSYVKDGVPQVGVVYDPFCDRLYSAAIGSGAFLDDEPLHVSTDMLDGKAVIGFDWSAKSEVDTMLAAHQLSLETGVYPLSLGSATHNAMLVASGQFVASIFPGHTGKCVDIAAAKVIVEEAGGRVTDLYGDNQRYDGDIRGAICSNGIVHEEIVQSITMVSKEEEA